MKHYTLKNGDIWTEEKVVEGQSTCYVAQDKQGNLYETLEEPKFFIDMTGAPSSWEPPSQH